MSEVNLFALYISYEGKFFGPHYYFSTRDKAEKFFEKFKEKYKSGSFESLITPINVNPHFEDLDPYDYLITEGD